MSESIAQSFQTLMPWHCEFRIIHPQRGIHWLRGASQPQKQSDGSVIWYGYISDITEQMHAKEALQHANLGSVK